MRMIARVPCATLALCAALSAGMVSAQVVPVVSASNPVTTLSRDQIADIFLGRASRFPDGSPAVPIDQPESSAVRNEFYSDYTGYSPARLKAHWSKVIFTGRGQPPRQASSSSEVIKLIASNPSAVGYIEQNAVDSRVKVLTGP